jgi:lactate dehydrogenase-like 2-hydroxyacid dehydrogenase
MKPRVLQLNPILIPAINEQLASLYCVHKLFETADQDAWLNEHGASIDAVITGGHTGISRAMLQQLPRLKVVAVNGVGTDAVDLGLLPRTRPACDCDAGRTDRRCGRSGHRTADCRLSQPVRR